MRYHLTALESSNRYLLMTLTGKPVSPGIPWMPDDLREALSLMDAFEVFKQVLSRKADMFGVEDGSWYAYTKSLDSSMCHELTTSERIKQEIDRRRSLGSLESNRGWPGISCLSHVASVKPYVCICECAFSMKNFPFPIVFSFLIAGIVFDGL